MTQAVDDTLIEILTARNNAAQGRLDQAVMSLRTRADSNSAAAETLEEVLAQAGRVDEALTECDRAIGRFGGGKIAHDKLNILASAGRLAEADAFATQLLAGPDLAPEQRRKLRRRLIQNRADQGQWSGAEHLCREALAEYPDDGDFAWGLITAQANQGHLDRAWASFQATQPPITRPETSQLWMALHAQFGFTQQDVATALDLVDRWPDTPDVGAVVLTGFIDLAGQHLPDGQPVLPDLNPGLLERFQAELRSYAQRYPEGTIRLANIEDVDFSSVIRAQLAHARPLHRAAAAVHAGRLPLGALAAAAGRPYAAMLTEQVCGPLRAITSDQQILDQERATAAQAINGEVVTEASTLAVITLIPERTTGLLSAFATVRLPRAALVDIDAARSDLTRAPGSTFSLSYDPDRSVLITQATSLPQHQHLARRINELDGLARTLVITDPAPATEPSDAHLAWLSAVDLAAERHVPLWSDDIAIRAVAASKGVPAFGTWALLTTLVAAGLIPDIAAEDASTLSNAGVAEIEAP